MHGAHQAPSVTNWTEFVNSAQRNRQQRMRELDLFVRQQMTGNARRCLPDPRHGPFSAKAGSPLQQSPSLQCSSASLRPHTRLSSAPVHNAMVGGQVLRKVTFNLPDSRPTAGSALVRPRSSLYRSASDGTLDTELQPDLQKLRTQRHLPEQPFNKHPLSPTLPMAKLRLQRQLTNERLQSAHHTPTGTNATDSIYQQTLSSHDRLGMNNLTQPLHAQSLPSSPIKRLNGVNTRSGAVGGSRLLGTTAEQQMARFRQRVPFCKSTPPSALMANSSQVRCNTPTGRQLAKYSDSPLSQMRNELKYFAQERKRELLSGVDQNGKPLVGSSAAGGGERVTYIGPYPPAWHQLSSSESDLNALLDLYSRPPDPVRDRQPPPGTNNFQRVPQYLLGGQGTSLQELRPLSARRASFNCMTGNRYGAFPSTYGYNAYSQPAYGSAHYPGSAWEWDTYGVYGSGLGLRRGPNYQRPILRYGSCGRLDDPYATGAYDPYYDEYSWAPQDIQQLDMMPTYDPNNNSTTMHNRNWTGTSGNKNCVTLLPTRPYRL